MVSEVSICWFLGCGEAKPSQGKGTGGGELGGRHKPHGSQDAKKGKGTEEQWERHT